MHSLKLENSDLLVLIRSRNRAGADALYDQYAQVFSLAIFRIVKHREVTERLLGEVILKIWDTIDQYKERETTLLFWMLAITKGLAKEYITSFSVSPDFAIEQPTVGIVLTI